ncbi:HEAT repeat domain-containing protein [Humisphaera borealis]|uniref:HEAT repeat domain-containing protein n=1 Tax=Humisphaera borealis TaxID=2807512 RepID=A0A7M2WTR8_9BACT|nr:HEAT repeat domain-containing protein [Humisphaera borealis]QOV88915.1 HEAT repeat domain-containing protein [Humisphaera borealis]
MTVFARFGRCSDEMMAKLIGILHRDPIAGNRAEAARTIATLNSGSESALKSLIQALNDADRSVRSTVATQLRVLGGGAAAAIPALRRLAGEPETPMLLRFEFKQAADVIEWRVAGNDGPMPEPPRRRRGKA